MRGCKEGNHRKRRWYPGQKDTLQSWYPRSTEERNGWQVDGQGWGEGRQVAEWHEECTELVQGPGSHQGGWSTGCTRGKGCKIRLETQGGPGCQVFGRQNNKDHMEPLADAWESWCWWFNEETTAERSQRSCQGPTKVKNTSPFTGLVGVGGSLLDRWCTWEQQLNSTSQKSKSAGYQTQAQWPLNNTGVRGTDPPPTVKNQHLTYSPKLYTHSFTLADSTNSGSKLVFSVWSWDLRVQSADCSDGPLLTGRKPYQQHKQWANSHFVCHVSYTVFLQ